MNTLFVDCKYGLSGDMMLTSLVDLGASQTYIVEELRKLPIDFFEIKFQRIVKQGISCLKLNLIFEESHHYHESLGEYYHHDNHKHETKVSHNHEHHHATVIDHHHHGAAAIFKMIEESTLPQRVKERSLALFKEVARAEGKIHGMPPEEVHFHEVGAMDSIIDTIGVCLALESLDVEELIFNRVPTGSGMIQITHGLYPVPAPATAEILIGVPLSDFTYEAELTTPTGASFAKVFASSYQDVPVGTVEKIGYGCGTKEFSHPNVLRTMLIKKKKKLN